MIKHATCRSAAAGTVEAFAAFIRREMPRIGKIVRDAGIQPE